jgi:SNF2-related domain/Helicase conserved C-terminal domain
MALGALRPPPIAISLRGVIRIGANRGAIPRTVCIGPSVTLPLNQDTLMRQLNAVIGVGSAIDRDNQVRRIEVSADRTRICGSVSGSRGRPYSQTIMLTPQGGGVLIKGYCNCPVGVNCEHVTAVLRQYLKTLRTENSDPAPASGRAKTETLPAALRTTSGQRCATISQPVAGWLDRLALATAPPVIDERRYRPQQRRLLFILNHEDAGVASGVPLARIRPVTVRVRKDGSVTDEQSYEPENAMRPKEQRARFLDEIGLNILCDLMWLKRTQGMPGRLDIALGVDAVSLRALEAILATGRLHYGSSEGPALAQGPAISAQPRWIKADRGAQQLIFAPVAPVAEASANSLELPSPGPLPRFDVILGLNPPHYIDLGRRHIGAINSGLSPLIAVEVAGAPVVSASELAIVKEQIRQQLKARPAPIAPCDGIERKHAELLPLPEAPDTVETRTVLPVPRLELIVATAKLKTSWMWYGREAPPGDTFALPLARLSFDYTGEIIASGFAAPMLEKLENDRLILLPRDMRAEMQAAERLAKLGLKAVKNLPFAVDPDHAGDLFVAPAGNPSSYELITQFDDPDRFIAFSTDAVPQLISEGWQVAFADDYPYRLAEGESRWWADIDESSGIDWFSFELGVEFEGHRINLLPHLTQMLNELPAKQLERAFLPGAEKEFIALCQELRCYHSLPDGRLLPLPGSRLGPMLKALLELIGPRGQGLSKGSVKLHRAEAAALAAFAGVAPLDLDWAASAERLIELGKSLHRGRSLKPVAPPSWFRAVLRDYQSDGLAWLDFLREAGFGGVLADDMGLGKTVQALAFLSREKEEGRLGGRVGKPALIVCPTSVLPNWLNETERFAPELAVLALQGPDRKQSFKRIAQSDVVLTTYALLARDYETLLGQEFYATILDEAQAIKNAKANISGVAHRINARHRLALSGTPLENNLGEVWSLFEFLSPGLLGDESTFRRTFRTPIEKHGDANAQAFLARRLKPFLLRRTKEEVAKELPPKVEIIERVRLEGAQRDLYETVRALMHSKVRDEIARKGLAKSHIIFLDALLKLRQTCCDPRLLRMPQARLVRGSAKLDRLMEMIPELLSEGRRILLFSQFTSMLALIEEELAKLNIRYTILTGNTKNRTIPVSEFQAGKVPLFLLSLKAGGTGLNLTAADTVIHYDPWWNPAAENQATDRAYRIGQEKPVFVYKLIVEEGVEIAIERLKARKAVLAEALFAGRAKTPLDLTEADISALFAPLDGRAQRRAA